MAVDPHTVGVLIVDEYEIVRAGLRAIVQKNPNLTVLADAANGEDASTKAAAYRPDLVLLNVSMPSSGRTAVTRQLLHASPSSYVAVLSTCEDLRYVRKLLAAGARAYVLERTVLQHLLTAIEVVLHGGIFVDPSLEYRSVPGERESSPAGTTLSVREIEVAWLHARGHSNREIATSLHIAIKTVETHKRLAMTRLRLKTRAQLVSYAIDRGWFTS